MKIATRMLAVVAAIALGLPTSVYAHGGNASLIHACDKPNSIAYIVGPNQSCNLGGSAVHWNIQGLKGDKGLTGLKGLPGADGKDGIDSMVPGPKGDKGEAGATGPQGATGETGGDMRLLDANGNSVGLVMGFDNSTIHLLAEDGSAFYSISAENNRFNTMPILYYETVDCTGEAYLDSFATVMDRFIEFGTTGTIVRVPSGSSAIMVSIKSYVRASNGTCTQHTFDHPLVQVELIDSSTLPFAYPIQFPVTFDF